MCFGKLILHCWPVGEDENLKTLCEGYDEVMDVSIPHNHTWSSEVFKPCSDEYVGRCSDCPLIWESDHTTTRISSSSRACSEACRKEDMNKMFDFERFEADYCQGVNSGGQSDTEEPSGQHDGRQN